MYVQPNAVVRKVTPYMVLYCLTPPQFHRYSSLSLCSPYPAWGVKLPKHASNGEGGTLLVNMLRNKVYTQVQPLGSESSDWQLATDHWQPFLPRSLRCSN